MSICRGVIVREEIPMSRRAILVLLGFLLAILSMILYFMIFAGNKIYPENGQTFEFRQNDVGYKVFVDSEGAQHSYAPFQITNITYNREEWEPEYVVVFRTSDAPYTPKVKFYLRKNRDS